MASRSLERTAGALGGTPWPSIQAGRVDGLQHARQFSRAVKATKSSVVIDPKRKVSMYERMKRSKRGRPTCSSMASRSRQPLS